MPTAVDKKAPTYQSYYLNCKIVSSLGRCDSWRKIAISDVSRLQCRDWQALRFYPGSTYGGDVRWWFFIMDCTCRVYVVATVFLSARLVEITLSSVRDSVCIRPRHDIRDRDTSTEYCD